MTTEKRQHPRIDVRKHGIEIFCRQANITGRLENISRGGLCFRYTPFANETAQSATVDILATTASPFYLRGIDCRLIYDIRSLAEDQSFTGNENRLCGMEFVGAEAAQNLEHFLKEFLEKH